jgi:SAM-dependent methyltransferase
MERAAYDRMRASEEVHWWFRGRRSILEMLLANLKGARPSLSILEVGCGTGGNLAMLKAFGEVQAVEPDDEARSFAAEGSGLPVAAGALPGPLPDSDFDLICALDVIEHVEFDREAVAALAGKLKPGGCILATVPAYAWMWSHHDVVHHHKRRYSAPQFRKLFEEAGLTVVRLSHFNAALLPLAMAVRAVKRMIGSKTGDDAVPSPWINRSLERVLSAERHWLRRSALPFGLSIFVIAQR